MSSEAFASMSLMPFILPTPSKAILFKSESLWAPKKHLQLLPTSLTPTCDRLVRRRQVDPSSEQELQRELNLALAVRRLGDDSGRGAETSAREEDRIRSIEVCMVQNVEELRPKL